MKSKPLKFGAGQMVHVKAGKLVKASAKLKPAYKITPAKSGGLVLENGTYHPHFREFTGSEPPKRLVFPNVDKLVKHLAKTKSFPWEGGKSGMPKPRGAAKAHRERQIETTGYPSAAKAYNPIQGAA